MEGFRSDKKENKVGMRASETASVVFEDCYVPDENLLGNEGEGFLQAMQVLDGGRISIAALSVGIASGCIRGGGQIRQGTAAVRQTDRRISGDPVQAGRYGDADRMLASADATGRRDKGRRQTGNAKVRDGKAFCVGNRRPRLRENPSRSTAATVIQKIIRPKNTGATQNSARSAKARPRSSGSSSQKIS